MLCCGCCACVHGREQVTHLPGNAVEAKLGLPAFHLSPHEFHVALKVLTSYLVPGGVTILNSIVLIPPDLMCIARRCSTSR